MRASSRSRLWHRRAWFHAFSRSSRASPPSIAACSDDTAALPDAPLPDAATSVPPAGPGTHHDAGELLADEIWRAADSPHIVANLDVVVRGGRTLTIEACAVVRLAEARSIVVGGFSPSDGTGRLVAHDARVIADDPATWWGSLQILPTGTAELDTVVLDRGGDPAQSQGGGGALLLRGDDNRTAIVRSVRAKGLAVTNAATYGINVRSSAGFTADSTDLAITGAGSRGTISGGEDSRYAMYVESPAIQTLPTTTTITGNARDEIIASAPFTIAVDERFPAVGVPYQVRDAFYMNPPAAGSVITLTIDPGVTIKLGGPLGPNASIRLGSGGVGSIFPVRVVAAGTATAPITVTSGAAAPAAGDWAVIDWQGGPATGNVMQHVTVEYGGGNSTTNGFGCGPGTTTRCS